jgi:hypothetical protein
MRKNLIRIGAAVAVSAGLAVGGAAIATAQDDPDGFAPFPSVSEQQDIFIDGGKNAGKGAAQLVSAAYLGVPASFMDFGQEIGVYGLHMMGEGSGIAGSPVK